MTRRSTKNRSANDSTLGNLGWWSGYGDLGHVGPQNRSSYAMQDIVSVRDDRQTHGSWLSDPKVMEAVLA